MTTPTTERSCGSCSVCCEACPVESLEKPAFTRCQHQGDGFATLPGCAIYADRPEECRAYRCAWLAGDFAEWHKPNLSGVLFERSTLTDGDGEVEVLLGMLTGIEPVDNDALGLPPDAFEYAAYAKPGTIVAIAGADEADHRVYGTPRDVKIWLDFIARARTEGFEKTSATHERTTIRVNGDALELGEDR